jgi:V-type H+-transporting ATPase subunit E
MEKDVTIQCRKVDTPLVTKAMAAAKAEFDQATGASVTLKIDEANPLPETCTGGVVLSVMDGRIRSENTFESRLELLGEKVCPLLSTNLLH